MMAESEGFEPPIDLRLCLISSQVHSTGLCQLSTLLYFISGLKLSPHALQVKPRQGRRRLLLGKGNELTGAGFSRSLSRCPLQRRVNTAGDLQVGRSGAQDDIGVVDRVGIGSRIGQKDVVESDADPVFLRVTVERDLAATG